MKILWKGAAALCISLAALGASAAPAQAQYYRDGYREWRGDGEGDRRWDDRRRWREHRGYWRDDRRHWRNDRRYRQRCWTEWRYDHYRDRNIRMRICR